MFIINRTVKIVIGVGIICILCLCFCFIFDSMAYTPGRFLFFVTCLHTLAFGFLCIGYYPWDSFYIIFAPAAFFAYVGLGIEFRIKGEKSLRISESYYATLGLCMFLCIRLRRFDGTNATSFLVLPQFELWAVHTTYIVNDFGKSFNYILSSKSAVQQWRKLRDTRLLKENILTFSWWAISLIDKYRNFKLVRLISSS